MKKLIILFLLLMPIVMANNITFEGYQDINVNVDITSGINIDYLSTNYDIDYVFANLTFFPRQDEFQTITNKNIIYDDELEEGVDYLLYTWNNPTITQIDYGLDYIINSKFKIKYVTSKIGFPATNIPDNIEIYLQPTEYINSDNYLIIQQANEIVSGEDDLYEAVFKIGVWTRENIDYDLNTLTAELVQDSVWVLNNKQGVCDELTALFIAMLRSVGIPAKFVSGVAYTNTIDGFGNHAWAEVYFPGKGWVAYDVTYGQFGYVDASHIKMKEGLDAKESSVNYGWLSNNVEINIGSMNIETSLVSTGNSNPQFIDLELNLLKNNVGGGSYVPIEIKLKNNNNYYMSTTVFVTKAPELLEDNRQDVLLKPGEEKSIFWILQVPYDLQEGYVYTSTIEVVDSFDAIDSGSLQYASDYDYYSLEEAENKLEELSQEEEKNYLSDLSINCQTSKETFYTYEEGVLLCNIENTGNMNLDGLQVCFLSDCQTINLAITGSQNVEFPFKLEESNQEYSVTVSNADITQHGYVDIEVRKSPNLRIENLDYPNDISYKDEGEIKFNLKSDSKAYGVLIKVNKKIVFDLKEFGGDEDFVIPFKGDYFHKNQKELKIEYKDNNGMVYDVKEDLNIEVVGVPFYVQIGWSWLLIVLLVVLYIFRKQIKGVFSKT
ncbi:MAG: transglutaminase-like domain-containing protein [Nanoarchaeota archaeon]|nr:transglutaminase-like domain-containing protein [Nanoarchaeota archaeon]